MTGFLFIFRSANKNTTLLNKNSALLNKNRALESVFIYEFKIEYDLIYENTKI